MNFEDLKYPDIKKIEYAKNKRNEDINIKGVRTWFYKVSSVEYEYRGIKFSINLDYTFLTFEEDKDYYTLSSDLNKNYINLDKINWAFKLKKMATIYEKHLATEENFNFLIKQIKLDIDEFYDIIIPKTLKLLENHFAITDMMGLTNTYLEDLDKEIKEEIENEKEIREWCDDTLTKWSENNEC